MQQSNSFYVFINSFQAGLYSLDQVAASTVWIVLDFFSLFLGKAQSKNCC
jgi:hypothetical protein